MNLEITVKIGTAEMRRCLLIPCGKKRAHTKTTPETPVGVAVPQVQATLELNKKEQNITIIQPTQLPGLQAWKVKSEISTK